MNMRLHAFEPYSRANGPGTRAVVWFQGCTLACPGCFNPAAQDLAGGHETEVAALAARIRAQAGRIEGLSVSGGEPFQQPKALAELLPAVRVAGLSTLVFSGYTMEEIEDQPRGPAILAQIDVLIAGRYDASVPTGHSLLSSANQRLHCLTGRYLLADFARVPATEIILHPDGSFTVTGLRVPPAWKDRD